MGPKSTKEHCEVTRFGPPHLLAVIGRNNFDLNVVARRNHVRAQALVDARHYKTRFLRKRNHLHRQALSANLGSNEPVEIPFHGRNVKFRPRRHATGNRPPLRFYAARKGEAHNENREQILSQVSHAPTKTIVDLVGVVSLPAVGFPCYKTRGPEYFDVVRLFEIGSLECLIQLVPRPRAG